jgi:hypothetical protein
MGGFIAANLGYRDCFTIPVHNLIKYFAQQAANFNQGYIQLGTFVVTLFCLPETLYHRQQNDNIYTTRSYLDMLLFKLNYSDKNGIALRDFLHHSTC